MQFVWSSHYTKTLDRTLEEIPQSLKSYSDERVVTWRAPSSPTLADTIIVKRDYEIST